MNRVEARRILEASRANGADRDDPQYQAAMKVLARDPEMASWLAELQSFDRAVTGALQAAVPIPGDLRASILAENTRVVRLPAVWWRPSWNSWRVRAAAAALVVLLGSMAGAYFQIHRGPTKFADFRNELVEESWNGQNHLAFRSSQLIRVKQWLAQNGGPTAFTLPPEFRNHPLHGCNMVHVGGHSVAVLCLANGSKHMHLFVAEDVQFADLPKGGAPDFERCGPWKTTAWRNGGRTYVLTGMSYPAFVNTFRKAGRWTMSG